ncbi:uncharacterized protein MEPE_03331 [Melanopsichium pennsylvanicum]|uniref:Uncharacterized protein n=1 Tax=Melanopsichium pennsylvanicum TaxID=63383 RepID=A0AAJ4XLS0_9BASI|nr:uncharacterized protein MEPE_03331 [Melanopsichium pennsylvanicum]
MNLLYFLLLLLLLSLFFFSLVSTLCFTVSPMFVCPSCLVPCAFIETSASPTLHPLSRGEFRNKHLRLFRLSVCASASASAYAYVYASASASALTLALFPHAFASASFFIAVSPSSHRISTSSPSKFLLSLSSCPYQSYFSPLIHYRFGLATILASLHLPYQVIIL